MFKDAIISKLYISFILFALLVNGIFFVVVNHQTKSASKQLGFDNIPKRVLTKEEVFKDFLYHANDILISVRQSKLFNKYLTNETVYKKDILEYFLNLSKANKSIMQFRYIDKSGLENIRIDRLKANQKPFVIADKDLQDKSNRYYFYDSKTKPFEKVWYSNLDLNMEHGKIQIPYNPTLRAMLPIEKDGKFHGVLILNFFMESILDGLTYLPLYNYKLINETGEILVSSNPNESWGSYKNKPITIKDIYPKVAQNILTQSLYKGEDFTSKRFDNIDLPLKLIMLLEVKDEYIKNASNSLIGTNLLQGVFIFIVSLIFAYFFAQQMNRIIQKFNKDIELKTKQLLEKDKNLNENVLYSRTDLRGVITDVSKVFCRLSGYSKEELLGQSHNIIRDPDMDSKVYEELWKTIKNEKVWKGELKNRTKNGGYYWVDAMVAPEYNYDGKHIGYVSIRHDITAQKNFEEQQMLIQEQAKMAALGEMIGNIAHQWRQPLSSISVMATGASYKKEMGMLEDEEFFESMEKINDSTKYLSETIDTFRDFLKAEKEKVDIDVYDLLKESLTIIKDSLTNNHIKVENKFTQESASNVIMHISKHEFQQVVVNILNNAKDVLLEKNKDDACICINAVKQNDMIVVTIQDNGGGIADDVMPKIFEPYFTTKHKSQGTGLGLHMAYKIITESFGGKIYAKNTQDGATFYIEIPLDKN